LVSGNSGRLLLLQRTGGKIFDMQLSRGRVIVALKVCYHWICPATPPVRPHHLFGHPTCSATPTKYVTAQRRLLNNVVFFYSILGKYRLSLSTLSPVMSFIWMALATRWWCSLPCWSSPTLVSIDDSQISRSSQHTPLLGLQYASCSNKLSAFLFPLCTAMVEGP
jgi:hypothetical protein